MKPKIQTKLVQIGREKVLLEYRSCAVPGCERCFWAKEKSNQSICSTKCYEIVLGRAFHKVPVPAVRRFGEKAIPRNGIVKTKLKGPENLRAVINSGWKLAAAKRKLAGKQSSRPLLHRAADGVH